VRFIATTTESIDDTPGERIMIELTATEIAFPSSCNTVRASYVLVDDVLDPAVMPAPSTTDGALPLTVVTTTTSPPPCDPDRPSAWALEVFDSFVGPLTVEIDIDRAQLRRSDGTGIDVVAP